jgi:hypothetical protein
MEATETIEDPWMDEDDESSDQRHRLPRHLGSGSASERGRSDGYSSEDEDDDDDDDNNYHVLLEITELPRADGRAVVTWSGDDDGDDSDGDELDELLALAEDDIISSSEGDVGQMWYQEISGSESESSSDDDGSMLVMESWTPAQFALQGESDGEDDYTTDYSGDTTDSLDDTDHVALVRFGIEVDADVSDAEGAFSNGNADFDLGVVSTEDGTTTISMAALAENPRAVVAEAAQNLGVNPTTAAKILASVGISVLMNGNDQERRSSRRRLSEGDNTNPREVAASGVATPTPSKPFAPAMGTFISSSNAPESSVVIDGSSNSVPSPFSAKKPPRSLRKMNRSSKVSFAPPR